MGNGQAVTRGKEHIRNGKKKGNIISGIRQQHEPDTDGVLLPHRRGGGDQRTERV